LIDLSLKCAWNVGKYTPTKKHIKKIDMEKEVRNSSKNASIVIPKIIIIILLLRVYHLTIKSRRDALFSKYEDSARKILKFRKIFCVITLNYLIALK